MRVVPIDTVMWPVALTELSMRAAAGLDDGSTTTQLVDMLRAKAYEDEKHALEQVAFYDTIDTDFHSRYRRLSTKLGEGADKTFLDEQKKVLAAFRDIIGAFEDLTAAETIMYMTRTERERIAAEIADFLDALLPALNLCDAFLNNEISRIQFLEQWKSMGAMAA